MMIMFWANIVTASVAFLLMALVTVGFAPHMRMKGEDANSMMSRFVALTSSLVWTRLLWWSLLRPIAGEFGWMVEITYSMSANVVNTGFNIGAVVAALFALAALHHSLPPHERTRYNWFSAPFYPRRFTLCWRAER